VQRSLRVNSQACPPPQKNQVERGASEQHTHTDACEITAIALKSSPIDFKQFRQETSVKYPTFTPTRVGDAKVELIAAAIQPIPVRPTFHHSTNDDEAMGGMLPQRQQPQPPQQLPPTPAPSPPPNNARLKKEKFQTDPNRPFLFPFSRSNNGAVKLVPYAIDEADRLYRKHMHVSLALFQMWQTREACILDESGTDPHSPDGIAILEREAVSMFGAAAPIASPLVSTDIDVEDSAEAGLPDVRVLDVAIAEAQQKLDVAEKDGDRALRRKLRERRDDLIRLRRVESLHVRIYNRFLEGGQMTLSI
jgi:hypothetical protein